MSAVARVIPDTRQERLALRIARSRAHAAFDRIWKSGNMRRSEAYRLLAEWMRLNADSAHIGLLGVAQCEELIAMLQPKPVIRYVRNRKVTL